MIAEIVMVPAFGCLFSVFVTWIRKHNREIYELIR